MSIGVAAQRSVCAVECTLAPELRHLIMVLAVLADHRTGEGLSGQERIASAMGYSPRTVRRLLAELADASSPVVVMRTPRMRNSGRGRTSDAYTLALQADTRDRVVADDQADAPVRLDGVLQEDAGDRLVTHDQPDTRERPTGHAEHDQPDTGVRASYPIRDPIRDPVSIARETAARTKPPRARKTKQTHQADARVLPLRDYYVERYRAANQGADPALGPQGWGRAMKAFAELLGAAKSEERARLCIERTFADPWRRSNACQPWEVARDANKLLALGHPAKPWVQRGGGERDLDAAVKLGAERYGGASEKQEGWGLAPPGEPEDDLPATAGGTA